MIDRSVRQRWSVAVNGRVIHRGLSRDQANEKVDSLVPIVKNIAMFQEPTGGDAA